MVGEGGKSADAELRASIEKLTDAVEKLTNALKKGGTAGGSLRGVPPCREGCEMPACAAEGCESPACRCCCTTCRPSSGTGQ
jgi:hypothetical protein